MYRFVRPVIEGVSVQIVLSAEFGLAEARLFPGVYVCIPVYRFFHPALPFLKDFRDLSVGHEQAETGALTELLWRLQTSQ